MTSIALPLRSASAKHSVRYIASFEIGLPIEKIDLHTWVTQMSDADYRSYSKSHKALGSFYSGTVFNMINVENIGNEMIVQHYKLKYYSPTHVQFYSEDTAAYILRWIPAVVGVPWEMLVEPIDDKNSRLVCLIGADFPNLIVKIGAWLNGLGGFFLRRHLNEEGRAFAKDIEAKFGA